MRLSSTKRMVSGRHLPSTAAGVCSTESSVRNLHTGNKCSPLPIDPLWPLRDWATIRSRYDFASCCFSNSMSPHFGWTKSWYRGEGTHSILTTDLSLETKEIVAVSSYSCLNGLSTTRFMLDGTTIASPWEHSFIVVMKYNPR